MSYGYWLHRRAAGDKKALDCKSVGNEIAAYEKQQNDLVARSILLILSEPHLRLRYTLVTS
jgi:hypothetical protein